MDEKPFRIARSLRCRFIRMMTASVCLAGLSVSFANDIVVNRVDDSGAGSLRQSLSGANSGDTLSFDPILNGTTLVNNGPIVLTNSVSLFDTNTISVTDHHAWSLAAPLTLNWAGTLTMNGLLSDNSSSLPGSLISNGAGTLILSSANTFTGGVVLNGGTLEVLNSTALGTGTLSVNNSFGNPTLLLGNGINLSNNISLGSALALNTANGNTNQLSGILSESGGTYGLTTIGSGTLILSGANTFTGGVFVTNDSTIRVLNSQALGVGTLSGTGAITLDLANSVNVGNSITLQNSLIANVASGTSTLSGSITETVSSQFTKTGAGTLIFGAANSYTGGTIVSQGMLQGDATSLTGNITDNATLIFNQTATGTFAGDIMGAGNLTKNGIGTLIVTGNNAFTGTTTVNTGELQVLGTLGGTVDVASINGALTGTGNVGNVINDGYVQPGTGATNNGGGTVFNIGTLTVNGDFTQHSGGTTEIKFNSGGNTAGVNNDVLNVSGQASLNGSLKVFAVGGGAFVPGTQYTILNATNGVSGQYAQATSNIATYGVDVTYGANDVMFQLVQTSSLHAAAVTGNQASVGQALDNITLSSTGSLFSMINSLGVQSSSQQQQSLSQLSGDMFGNLQTLGLQVGNQFQQSIITRLTSNSQFLIGQSTGLFDDEEMRGQFPRYGSSKGWLQGFGTNGNIRGDGNAGGLNYNQGGAVYGLDWGDDDSGCMGITGGNSYVGFNNGSGGGGQLTAYQVGLYMLRHNDFGYVLGTTNYGFNQYNTNRSIAVGGLNESLHANYNGNQVGANIESGLKLRINEFHIQPFVGLQYIYLTQQAFNESGGPAALSVGSNQANSLRGSLGARVAAAPFLGPQGAVWTPYANLRVVSELLDNDRLVNASFNGAPVGGAFTTQGAQIGRVFGVLGPGAQVRINDSWALFGGVDFMFGNRMTTETGSLAAMYYW